ncbi:MAG: hypothetical protein N3D79_05065 [Acidilobaceae archaeon]|nr:hypothetical protein [Acidilobaceae archaeon]
MSALISLGLLAYVISFLAINAPLLFIGGAEGFLAALIYAIFLIAAGAIWVLGTILIFLGYLRSPKTRALSNPLLIAGTLSIIGSLELIVGGVHRAYTPRIEIGSLTLQFSALLPLLGILSVGLVQVFLGFRLRSQGGQA